MSREIRTDVNAILDLVLLTEDDEGTTGTLLRRVMFAMLGEVTDADVDNYVPHYARQMYLGWCFITKRRPLDVTPIGSIDEGHVRAKLRDLLRDMRADAGRAR